MLEWELRRALSTKKGEGMKQIQENIDRYISGELTRQEIDQLWIVFLKEPEWYSYFLTLLHLYAMVERSKTFQKLKSDKNITVASC